MQTARKDGIVTEHEKLMIQHIMERITDYTEILDQALKDEIITPDEKVELYKFRTKIFVDNLRFVNEDSKITIEEKSMVETLNTILAEMGDIENIFANFD